jgi:hypothetical protein
LGAIIRQYSARIKSLEVARSGQRPISDSRSRVNMNGFGRF